MQPNDQLLDDAWNWVRSHTSQSAPCGSVPLRIHDEVCGILTPHSLSLLQELPSAISRLYVRDDNGIRLAAADVNQALEASARELVTRNALPEWRNEKLDIVADRDHHLILGAAERGIFRFFGFLTQCVHAVGCDAAGNFYCGLRSATKSIDPNLLDTLSGGLVSSQETWITALARETGEEAGLDPCDYDCGLWSVWTAERPVDTGYMRELTASCRISLHPGVKPHNRDGEVATFELLSCEQLVNKILCGQVTLEAALSFLSFLSPLARASSHHSYSAKK